MKAQGDSTSLLASEMALQGPFVSSEAKMAQFFRWDDDADDDSSIDSFESRALREWPQVVASSPALSFIQTTFWLALSNRKSSCAFSFPSVSTSMR